MEELLAALAAQLRGWLALMAFIWEVAPVGAVALIALPIVWGIGMVLVVAIAWEPWRLRRVARKARV